MPSSPNIRLAPHLQLVEKICIICSSPFKVHPKGAGNARYCSDECMSTNQSTARQYERMNVDDNPRRYFKALLGQKNRRVLSADDLMEIWEDQNGVCALSGIEMTYRRELGKRIRTNASIDRIEVGGPYIKSNVRLVCSIVNKMRLDMSDEELNFWCKHIQESRHS